MDRDKILAIDSDDRFEDVALELFALQSERCQPYREYLDLMGIEADSIRRARDIPHLPIELFKSQIVYWGEREAEKVFTSSTTGGDTPSRHYMDSLHWYERCFRASFARFYGEPEGWSFYCLLPCYLEREGSSLVYMADKLIEWGGGGFYLDDHQGLLEKMSRDPKPKILLGVSYALWDLAEKHPEDLKDTIVMETGGMKGRRREIPKEELHAILKEAFRVEAVHSEYGMAELTSQAYSKGENLFSSPPWMRIWVRDINDPMDLLGEGARGGINITDLSNFYSCAFIQTQDLGKTLPGDQFTVLGRMENSQTRGCNLLVG